MHNFVLIIKNKNDRKNRKKNSLIKNKDRKIHVEIFDFGVLYSLKLVISKNVNFFFLFYIII